MAPKFSKPSSFAHMAPPRSAGHRGYKKHGDGSNKVACGTPSSSDAPPRDVPETSSFGAGDGSSGDENDDLNQAGGGGSSPPSNNGSEGSDGDGIEEASEEESGTGDEIVNPEGDDLKSKCAMLENELAMLENELEKVGKMSQAFFLFNKAFIVMVGNSAPALVLKMLNCQKTGLN